MLCILSCWTLAASAQSVHDKPAIKSIMDKVNNYQLAHPHAKYDDNWIRGTYYAGVMACYQATGDKKYLEQCDALGRKLNWKVPAAKPSINTGGGGNLLTLPQTWLESYMIDKQKYKIEPLITYLENPAKKSPTSMPLDWYFEGGRRYVDGLFTGAPPLAMLYTITKDEKYLQWMEAFFWDIYGSLYDVQENLFYRDHRFITLKTSSGKKVLWSRGNGWAIAAIVRIMKYLPKEHASYKRYEQVLKNMANALKKCQSKEGFWYPNLADPYDFPVKETSGTAFFVYGLAWGVNNGILDRAEFLPVIEKAWKSLYDAVSDEGKLQWGQRVGDRPVNIVKNDSHEYVSGTFLLAASEVYRLNLKTAVESGRLAEPGTASALSDFVRRTNRCAFTKSLSAATATCSRNTSPPTAVFRLNNNWLMTDKKKTFLSRVKTSPELAKTGLSKNDYLKIIEGQVRAIKQYQDVSGRIIDPVKKKEMYYATPCYAHSVAILAASGYTKDAALVESGMKAMDVVTADMALNRSAGGHGDFYTWPVMFAYRLYKGIASEARWKKWHNNITAMKSEKFYRYYRKLNAHNWVLINTAGEYLRFKENVTKEKVTLLNYVDTCLKSQMQRFTEYGMYIDDYNSPPPAYDLFSRQYLSSMLAYGYQGAYYKQYRDLLNKGAWMSLFLQSPFGEAPAGFRSAHHIWNEAEQCVIFEIYANEYAKKGEAKIAEAFKRAAMLSLSSIKSWLRPDGSGYIVKNKYPIAAQHGYEGYSVHTCYNMLTTSMLAQAWEFANDKINEGIAPVDLGGYVVAIHKPFHKVFASAGGAYVEYDTRGDQKYNPTGIIRIHLKGSHPQLGPSDGCAALYSGKGVSIAIGPSWQNSDGTWFSLAKHKQENPIIETLKETPEMSQFRIIYLAGERTLTETVTVENGKVTVEDELSGNVTSMRITWPLLTFNGKEGSEVKIANNAAVVKLEGKSIKFTAIEPVNCSLVSGDKEYGHRNGKVKPLYFEFRGNKAKYSISLN
jgi:rhamnogalacturonyl hydrolase YesR